MPENRIIAALTSKGGLGALLLFICALVVFTQVAQLRIGSASAMGPGYFPMLLGGLFIFFGLLLTIEGWRHPEARIDLGPLRPVLLVLVAIVIFAVLYKPLGGAVSLAALIVVSALAERGRTLKQLVMLTVIIVALIWLIFSVALGLQFNMLPGWL